MPLEPGRVFDSLSDKLQAVFRKLSGKGKLSEADVGEAMREVRLALLEADVNFKVVKDFIARVKEKAVGVEILESLSPVQQVVKIVNDELVELLGGEQVGVTFAAQPPTIIMLCGLQGAGKTTLTGKLGNYYKKQGRNPILVACDTQRPAAVKQLRVFKAVQPVTGRRFGSSGSMRLKEDSPTYQVRSQS